VKHSSSGINLLRRIASEGFKIFTIEKALAVAIELGIETGYVPEVLHLLLKDGWVERLKRGTYALSAESGFGVPPHDFEIAMALVQPCAISHWTAMHYHHLTQQTPNTVFAITITSAAVPRSLKGGRFHFVKIKEDFYFGTEKVWVNQAQIQITDPERTLLDGLMMPQYCGDFHEVFHAFKISRGNINLQKIIQYALRLDGATIKRLGWVLDRLKIEKSLLLELETFPIKGYRKLDASGPLEGFYNKKWMVQENIGVL
jgi:predicted transcriptional regulator of viral defense system